MVTAGIFLGNSSTTAGLWLAIYGLESEHIPRVLHFCGDKINPVECPHARGPYTLTRAERPEVAAGGTNARHKSA
jgi:hypothetical protein